MKIVQLNAENIKRLVAVEIRPSGNLVEIAGRNGQGKTSVLDAIWWALTGKNNLQAKPVRDGQESGFITLDLGDYKVTRKFKVKEDDTFTTSLTVENADGAKYGSPQDVLNGFIGDLAFDPLAFSRMKSKDQVTALRAMVPDYDFDRADADNQRDFSQRTDVNRSVRDLRARVDAIVIPAEAPTERVSAEDLLAELQQAMDGNSAVDARANKVAALDGKITYLTETITQRREQIASWKAKIVEAERGIESAELAIEELRDEIDAVGEIGEKQDIEPIREKISRSEEINRLVSQREQREALLAELKSKEAESASLTKAIDDRKEAAAAAVRSAQLPVPGLTLTDDAVLLNGVPFEQASDAEQLRVSIAVAGAMNPKLRVIRVRDGSLLDEDAMKALAAYADENDLQIWVERVDSSGKVGVVIEDGMVRQPFAEAAE